MEQPPFPAAVLEQARAAAKAELRDAGTGEDGWIAAQSAAALATCEAFTGRALILREWTAVLPAGRGWQQLPAAPVTAITGATAIDPAGTRTILPSDAYAIDIDADGSGWVRFATGEAGQRIEMRFTAGTAASWDALPPPIAQGVVLLTAHLLSGAERGPPPACVSALWRPWRRMPLTAAAHQ